MKYYYDIILNFNDYPIHYYEWSSSDNIERFLKIKVLRVEDVSVVIEKYVSVNLDDGKYILCDGINSIGIEVINGKVIYLSYLSYKDDNYICDIVNKLDLCNLEVSILDSRKRIDNLKCDEDIKFKLLNLVNNGDDDFIKYIYYEVVGKIDNIDVSRSYLLNDIRNNFNNMYYSLYINLIKML